MVPAAKQQNYNSDLHSRAYPFWLFSCWRTCIHLFSSYHPKMGTRWVCHDSESFSYVSCFSTSRKFMIIWEIFAPFLFSRMWSFKSNSSSAGWNTMQKSTLTTMKMAHFPWSTSWSWMLTRQQLQLSCFHLKNLEIIKLFFFYSWYKLIKYTLQKCCTYASEKVLRDRFTQLAQLQRNSEKCALIPKPVNSKKTSSAVFTQIQLS